MFGGAQVLVSTFVSPVLGGISVAVLAALVLRISPRGFPVPEDAAILAGRRRSARRAPSGGGRSREPSLAP